LPPFNNIDPQLNIPADLYKWVFLAVEIVSRPATPSLHNFTLLHMKKSLTLDWQNHLFNTCWCYAHSTPPLRNTFSVLVVKNHYCGAIVVQ
jgi:hypothetical protein